MTQRVAWRLIDAITLGVVALVAAWAFGAPTQLEVALSPAERGDEAEELLERERWFDADRKDATGKLPAGAWARAQKQADGLRTQAALATDPLNWSLLGPHPIDPPASGVRWDWGGSTPYSGRVTAIATHPDNRDIAYIGAAHGGVWRTTNGGGTWAPVFDNAPAGASIQIGAVTIDPNDANTLYVGTGEANFGNKGDYFGTGLYRSTNAGGQWTKLGGSLFDSCSIGSVVVKRGEPQTIVVAVASGSVRFNTLCDGVNRKDGIYLSTNGGANWSRRQIGNVSKIVAAPNNPAVLYAGLYNGGVYKSSDSGSTWTKLTDPDLPTGTFGRVEVTAVAAGATSPTQTVYAVFATHDTDTEGRLVLRIKGVYRSNDGGVGWAPITSPASDFCGDGQCQYDLVIAADPRDPGRMYLGGVLLNRYTSNVPTKKGFAKPAAQGSCPYSAKTGTTSCIHVDFHAMAFDAGGRLWIGSDGGVWRTADGAETFSNLNNDLSNIQFYPGIAGSLTSNLLVGGAQDNASARYSGGQAWSLIGYGDGSYQAIAGGGSVIVATRQQGILNRTIGGSFCEGEWGPSGGAEDTAFIAPLVGSPTATNTIYAATSAVYRSTNADATCGRLTWTRISQYFKVGTAADLVREIMPASDGATVYAATDSGKVYVTGGSATWSLRTTGLPGTAARRVTDFWVSPTSAGTVYATVAGFAATHLYKTTDFGTNWQSVSGNLPNSPASAVVVDTVPNPDIIYVGTDHGVFWSQNDGTTWNSTSVGLPRTVVTDLLIDKTAKKIVAATYGRGMWVAPLLDSGVAAGPTHDAFASAKAVTALPYTDTAGSTANATVQAGENGNPTCTAFMGKTVWYRYSPATTTTVVADTNGSPFDTVIVAYQGTDLGGLTPVACDDDGMGVDGGASKTGPITVTAGQTYYFQVGGWIETAGGVPTSGNLTFHLTQGGPVNDSFAGASVVGALPFKATVPTTALATTQTGEDVDPSCTDFIGKTVWYKYVPGSSGTVTVDTIGSNFDTVLVAFQGTTLGGLAEVGCDDDSGATGGGVPSKITSLAVTAGQTYYFQAGGWIQTAGGVPASGALTFNIVQAGSSNDAFAGASVVGALPYAASLPSTSLATTEAGEDVDPSCTDFIGKTVWYKYVPGSSGTVTVDTIGSSFDTVVVAFQGTTLAGLTEVGCDDDGGAAGSGGPSRITSLPVTSGQTYYFQVGGWRSAAGTPASGALTFNVAQGGPANDPFAGASVIGPLPFAASVPSTALATTQASEDLDPSCTQFIGKTVWYKYVPGATGTVTVDTTGSNFDTVVVAFQGTTLAGLAEVGCNDDLGASGGPSRITSMSVTSGQTYYFQVGGWAETGVSVPASGALSISVASP